MRYGIISDIHGNLEAFETVIEALVKEKVDDCLCVGDIVGYGANPVECIKKTKDLNLTVVCGNHDAASVGLADISFFNDAAKAAVLWTEKNISQEDKDFLQNLGIVFKNRHLTLVHGTLQEPELFHYMLDKNAALKTFDLMETRVSFVGHSHVPGIFSSKHGNLTYFYKEKITFSRDERLIVNVGSIGQPRDGDPRLCYSIYDTDKNIVELRRLPYNVEKAQKKILDAGLPPFLAHRLSQGI